jgi:hypothetical protein
MFQCQSRHEALHEISNDNEVRLVNVVTSEKLPKYHMKILLGGFSAKAGTKFYTKLVMIMKLD